MPTLNAQLNHDGVNPELKRVLDALADVTKTIARKVRVGPLNDLLGSAEQQNVQGETQKKLDVIANDLIKAALLSLPEIRAIASEEEEHAVAGQVAGQYVVAFDPLDGSSNIDINGQVGTIFTVYAARDDVSAESAEQFSRPGREQVCAGYVLYGPATQMALTIEGPSRLYTLNEQNEYQLTQSQLVIPPECAEFAINMANYRHWDTSVQSYIDQLQAGSDGPRQKNFNMRWNGAMVGDVHRVLLRGGIFLYPANVQSKPHSGKLRLLYEANPMALLVERAGGRATDGARRILDLEPAGLHQRVPVVLGSAREVMGFSTAC